MSSVKNAAIISAPTFTVGCPFLLGAPPYTGLIGFSDGVAVCFREARTSDNREDRFEGVEAGFLGGGGGGGGGIK